MEEQEVKTPNLSEEEEKAVAEETAKINEFLDGVDVNPFHVIIQSCIRLGWSIAIPKNENPDAEIEGVSLGKKSYLEGLFGNLSAETTETQE
jgi:hypothetical protein